MSTNLKILFLISVLGILVNTAALIYPQVDAPAIAEDCAASFRQAFQLDDALMSIYAIGVIVGAIFGSYLYAGITPSKWLGLFVGGGIGFGTAGAIVELIKRLA